MNVSSVIQSLFTTQGDYAQAGALSVVLLVIIVALVMLYVRRSGSEDLL